MNARQRTDIRRDGVLRVCLVFGLAFALFACGGGGPSGGGGGGGESVSLTTLIYFDPNPDSSPSTGVIQGSDGNFYGATSSGGEFGYGAFYRITPAGVESILYSFSGGNTDGATPNAALIEGKDGNFYGTSFENGAYGRGTVYEITPGGIETVLHSFGATDTDGSLPVSGLIQAADGNFYGTTTGGGVFGDGTVYRITSAGVLTVLYSFGVASTDGKTPNAALSIGADGDFYGTTSLGGSYGGGTVFKLTPTGVETVLYSFGASVIDDSAPYTGVTQGVDGNFYGTTTVGGAFGLGAVYKITPAGEETILFSFLAASTTDVTGPSSGLIQGADGNFYGTTSGGGASGLGCVYKITPTGVATVLYSFDAFQFSSPQAVIQAADGYLYYAGAGGGFGDGAVYRITSSGAEALLYSFGASAGVGVGGAGVTQGIDKNFYGTTTTGGGYGQGTVYEISQTGAETVLYSFDGANGTDATLQGVIQGVDGNLYGTTLGGGAYGKGTVSKITPGGLATVLYSFGASSTDGANPSASLILGSDGNFYGTTNAGGIGNGSLFRLSSSGIETVLYSIVDARYLYSSGTIGGVNQGADGNLYGTTPGVPGTVEPFTPTQTGTVYKVTPLGVGTVLYVFGSSTTGYDPVGVILATDGNLYGTTKDGGTTGNGTFFRITPSGVETILHSFGSTSGDGQMPEWGVIQGSDGNFYGATQSGGPQGLGTVFKMTLTGSETILYSFGTSSTNITSPSSGLIQDADGNFYGTATGGGANHTGGVYKLMLQN